MSGLCGVCGKSFVLRRKTKHPSYRTVRGICPPCSVEKQRPKSKAKVVV